jgi:DNA-binding protein HU-beta
VKRFSCLRKPSCFPALNLVEAFADSGDESKTLAGETINAVLGIVTRPVTVGDVVQPDDFESFSTEQHPVRISNNSLIGAGI